MPVLKSNRTIVTDDWQIVGQEETLPLNGDVIVPFARLLTDYQLLRTRPGRLGVCLSNDQEVSALTTFFDGLDLIELDFPSFSDGRAFSQARRLRQNGFRGELRASGNVLPDQLQFMHQVGFSSFAISDRFPRDVWIAALETIALAYQPDVEGTISVWKQRQTRTHEQPDKNRTWLPQQRAG